MLESSSKGIDIGSSIAAALVAFAGDSEEQARVFFKVKGKKVLAAATSKKFALEVEGKACEGSEEGEWPVHKRFLSELADVTVDGSAKVPAIIGRLLLERTGVKRADLVFKESGQRHGGHEAADVAPENRQLSFAQIHKTIDVDFEAEKVSWFPLEKGSLRALGAVYGALGKGGAVSFVGGGDEQAPVGFQAKGEGITIRGILIPPAVQGPGKAAVDPDDDDDDDDDSAESRTGDLFDAAERKRKSKEAVARVMAEDDDEPAEASGTDDAVIDDAEAERIKAAQAKAPKLATEKKRTKRVQKKPKAGSR